MIPHLRSRMLGLLLLCSCAAAGLRPEADERRSRPPTGHGEVVAAAGLLLGTHQLTFAGRRSGEGYFGRDGTKLVFQSERDETNPFYQIHLMDLETGAIERISPGIGKTTCAWLHPGGQRVLFSSTHLDPQARAGQERELASRAADDERRYAWDYDEWYDIFSASLASPQSPLQRLTRARGYDAEASWSPDGREIVFASNRHAYAEGGAAVDAEQLAKNPAHFVELYLMDANGGNLRRLTDTPGYDGGPFFSPDGSRIVWRRFSEDGASAEIFTMKTDGSDVRQLTRLGAMSWAPFYHPSGEYVAFTTNLHGFDDFELYLVDVDGRHAPVRATRTPGFDGLPAFSPDGQQIVWTSNRSADHTSQLFRARWNDALARALLDLPVAAGSVVAPLLPLPATTSPTITEADLRAHASALASELTEGRLAGTPGERVATSYVARAFRAAGLEPAGDAGTYFQEFGFTAGVSLGEQNRLEPIDEPASGAPQLVVDHDFRPFAFSSEGEVPASEVVYAGYGIVAPEAEGQRSIDSYAGLDVTDRWVLVFRYVPEGLSQTSRQHLHRYSSLRYKAMVARDKGARGILVVSGPNSKVREELVPLRFDVSLSGTSIAAISISDATAERLLRGSGQTLAQLQDAADRSSGTRGFPLPGLRLAASVDLEQQRRRGRNVLARLQVGAEPSRGLVILGAHVDHLGRGEGASSLALADERGQIHYGADDNASGVAALLEIGEALADLASRDELAGSHDILFAAWSGEELGLLGSSFFVNNVVDNAVNPHEPGAKLADSVVAYLNMDMIGRMQDSVSLFGLASSPDWPRLIEQHNIVIGLPISAQNDAFLPTDATSFYMKEVPILSAFTGAHTDYHTPRDVVEKLDFPPLARIARLMAGITASLAEAPEGPRYTASTMPARQTPVGGIRAYLGTIPDYAQTDQKGVLLAGVAKAGPAERAGVRGGDIVVELAGRAIENIYDYTYALDALAIDEPAAIVVLRGGERVELEIVPASRE